MIVYDLACPQGHRFEGWFDSGEAFARQQESGYVRCPVCDDAQVERLPSARVSVAKAVAPGLPAAPAAQPSAEAIGGIPAEVLGKLREMVRSAENVGRRFPEEARKIHYDEAPARAIRGQASAEEATALRDEGIDFATLPPILTEDPH